MEEQIRELFEARYSNLDRGITGHDFSTHQDGSYVNDDTSTAFSWFKEGAALSANHIGYGNEMAKYQPCGCVICTCEHETQCQGCGAKNCGTHAVGDIPNPVFKAQRPVKQKSKDTCSDCGQAWDLHDFGAPKPDCPSPAQEQDTQTDSDTARHNEWLSRMGKLSAQTQEPVSKTPNDDHVICPNCAHDFRAIPVNVQKLMIDAGFEPPFIEPVKQESWISVEDRLPEGDRFVDVFVKSRSNLSYGTRFTEFRFINGKFDLSSMPSACYVSHWMPLPLPPAQVNTSK